MTPEQAYEWLAAKLSTGERKALDVIFAAIGEADAQRLDWLERKLFDKRWNGVLDSGSRTDWTIQRGYRHVVQQMEGRTFREAVDTAIKASN